MLSVSSFDDFKAASNEVLSFLRKRLGFDLWMVTRVDQNDWIVLTAVDHGYQVEPGHVFQWTDSFCSRMVNDLGPRIAPNSNQVPAYAEAPIGQQVAIGAYIGVPLLRNDGSLFGTLCAVDPQPQPDEIVDELPTIEMLASLLTTILEKELAVEAERKCAERARARSLSDPLTGLYNLRGWEELAVQEVRRCQRYGNPATLLSIDLDDLKCVNDREGHAAGDALLKRTAMTLLSVARDSDIIARLGGDEFWIMAVECERTSASALLKRLSQAFESEAISASIGMAFIRDYSNLASAMEAADSAMYAQKHIRKTQTPVGLNVSGRSIESGQQSSLPDNMSSSNA